jgi:hypothetical protein
LAGPGLVGCPGSQKRAPGTTTPGATLTSGFDVQQVQPQTRQKLHLFPHQQQTQNARSFSHPIICFCAFSPWISIDFAAVDCSHSQISIAFALLRAAEAALQGTSPGPGPPPRTNHLHGAPDPDPTARATRQEEAALPRKNNRAPPGLQACEHLCGFDPHHHLCLYHHTLRVIPHLRPNPSIYAVLRELLLCISSCLFSVAQLSLTDASRPAQPLSANRVPARHSPFVQQLDQTRAPAARRTHTGTGAQVEVRLKT